MDLSTDNIVVFPFWDSFVFIYNPNAETGLQCSHERNDKGSGGGEDEVLDRTHQAEAKGKVVRLWRVYAAEESTQGCQAIRRKVARNIHMHSAEHDIYETEIRSTSSKQCISGAPK